MENPLILSDKDLEKIQINVILCETCGTILNKDNENCIFCGKNQCWNCKLHCLYEHHRKEVKK